MIYVVLFVASLVAFVGFNISRTSGKTRKRFIAFNAVMCSLLALTYFLNCADSAAVKRDSDNYAIYGGGFFGGMSYERTEDGYYIIRSAGFLSPSEEIAVPKEKVSLPPISNIYEPILVYFNRAEQPSRSEVSVSSKEYQLWENVVKIRPEYTDLFLIIMAAELFILFISDFVIFICVLAIGKKSAEK